jgi:hypothetical protein
VRSPEIIQIAEFLIYLSIILCKIHLNTWIVVGSLLLCKIQHVLLVKRVVNMIIDLYRRKVRRMRWAGHVARMGEERDVYRDLMGKPEGKRQLGRPRRRWDQNGS